MSPLKRSNNIAARMGRWSASHWKTATFGWLAFVIAAFVIGGALGTKTLVAEKSGNGESGKAASIAYDQFRHTPEETILIQSKTLTTGDTAFKAAVDDTVARFGGKPYVKSVASPYAPGNQGQISEDRHSALVTFKLREKDLTKADEQAPAMLATTAAIAKAHPAVTLDQVGDATIDNQLNDVFAKDLAKAGELSLPVTLLILLIAFGALVAAGIPLLLGLTSVFATMGLLGVASQWYPVDSNIFAVILLIGLAVGVDYSMFYLKREREERRSGKSAQAALEAAAATSGRSVLISGLTVMAAMSGMFFTGDKTFGGFAMGTMIVVATAVLGSLTVLPALLGRLGDKVEKGRIPYFGRLQQRSDGRVWGWILDRVLRRPVLSAVLSAGVLILIAAPAIGMKLVVPGADAMPQDLTTIQAYNKVQKAFPGDLIPANILIKADNVRTPEVQNSIKAMVGKALATGQLHDPVSVDVNRAGTVEVVSVSMAGNGTNQASIDSLKTLREDIIPATVGQLDSVDWVGVDGQTAESVDFNKQMKHSAPYVFTFVLLLAFILLLLSFRSIVIAAKAIVLNLLSVAAAFGVLTIVFQHGVGKSLLGFEYTGGVIAFLPVFLFVILFGLSMDYHVFILSRVREAYDRGMKTEEAVAYGIKQTAGVVTSAAIVMVFVFSIFGTLDVIMLKQFGVGLAAAVLIDATIIRGVLLPASMKLLGDWNWYLPRWLEWLPQIGHETEEPAPEQPAVAAL
jgi:RND superfamily putative drug exporter